MSYILEALKKSQQDRELGQVPTLDTSSLFTEDKEAVRPNYWGLLAVGLAALAVVIALYAALRQPMPAPVGVAPPSGPTVASPSQARAVPETAAPILPLAVSQAPLVEAPPPKRSWHAPEPLADPEDPVPPDAGLSAGAALDPRLEWELQRQLDAEQAAGVVPEPAEPGAGSDSSLPPDLIQDIEEFKQQVRREQGIPPPPSKRLPARISGDPTHLSLTPRQQAQVPAYLMTVHVYDPDVTKRFVIINALKYHEDEETREGLRVERILPEGTVLSYLGNPFFVSR